MLREIIAQNSDSGHEAEARGMNGAPCANGKASRTLRLDLQGGWASPLGVYSGGAGLPP